MSKTPNHLQLPGEQFSEQFAQRESKTQQRSSQHSGQLTFYLRLDSKTMKFKMLKIVYVFQLVRWISFKLISTEDEKTMRRLLEAEIIQITQRLLEETKSIFWLDNASG